MELITMRTRPLRAREKALLAGAGAAVWWRAASALRRGGRGPLAELKAAVGPAPDRSWTGVLKAAAAKWSEDEAPRRGAALAYYSLFSVGPLLLVIMAVVGLAFGDEAARGLVGRQLDGFIGADKARVVQDMVQAARSSGGGGAAGVIGTVMLLVGAGAVVGELQASMARMWGTLPRSGGLGYMLRTRLLSMAFALGLGFLLLVSLVLGAAVSGVGKYLEGFLPLPEAVLQGLNVLLSFGTIAAVFALMFKYLPRARVAWSDVALGAVFTAALFTAGNYALTLYLGKAGPSSAYGAAGSLLAFLLWGYYCAQILYFGAEFTRAYAERRGSGLPARPGGR